MNEKPTGEAIERLRRIETRLVQVADHLGLDVRTTPHVRIVRFVPPVVTISSLDCSASRVVNALKEQGIIEGTVDIMLRGDTRVSMTINLDNLK